MTTPQRIQLSRRKGFNLQAVSVALNGLPAVNVARPSRFGNPITCSRPYGCPYHPEFRREEWIDSSGSVSPMRCCVDAFRHYVESGIAGVDTFTGRVSIGHEAMDGYPQRAKLVDGLPDLRGKNLGCWCPLPAPGEPDCCHAAVLLELAQKEF